MTTATILVPKLYFLWVCVPVNFFVDTPSMLYNLKHKGAYTRLRHKRISLWLQTDTLQI